MKTFLKKYFKADFFLPNIIVPLISLTLVSTLYLIFINRYLYEVVSYYFVVQFLLLLLKFLLIIIVMHLIISIGIYFLKKNRFSFSYSREKFDFSDFFLLLLPLTPVSSYLLNNLDFYTF